MVALQWNCFFCLFNYFPAIPINLFLSPRGCSVVKVYSTSVHQCLKWHTLNWVCECVGKAGPVMEQCESVKGLRSLNDLFVSMGSPSCSRCNTLQRCVSYESMQLISALCYWNGTTAHHCVPGKHATLCSYCSSAVCGVCCHFAAKCCSESQKSEYRQKIFLHSPKKKNHL